MTERSPLRGGSGEVLDLSGQGLFIGAEPLVSPSKFIKEGTKRDRFLPGGCPGSLPALVVGADSTVKPDAAKPPPDGSAGHGGPVGALGFGESFKVLQEALW